jgi:chromosome segregation ATPase
MENNAFEDVERLLSMVGNLQRRRAELEFSINSLNSAIESRDMDITQLSKKHESLRQQLLVTTREYNDLGTKNIQAEQELMVTQQAIKNMTNNVDSYDQKIRDIEVQMEKEMTDFEQHIAFVQTSYNELEELFSNK